MDSPYFATSGEGGVFTITSVPPGDYTYHAWRSGGHELQGTVTVGSNTAFGIGWPGSASS